MPDRHKLGCQPCRDKHLKCDQDIPTCRRCLDTGRECVKTYTYRFHKAHFAKNQKWFTVKRPLSYVDETRRVVNYYATDVDSFPEVFSTTSNSKDDDTTPTTLPNHRPRSAPSLGQTGTGSHQIGYGNYSNSSNFLNHDSSSQGLSIAQIINSTPENNAPLAQHSLPLDHYQLPGVSNLVSESSSYTATLVPSANVTPPYHPSPRPLTHTEHPAWPLIDRTEAHLLRHFIKNLAIWLDLCDPLQHFQTVVPQRAGSSRILLNAIFALSARHLHKIGDYDPYASNRYHDECLKYLIPMLNDASTISDQSIFAATIILRVLEEMDVASAGIDPQGHMLGIQVFVSAIDPAPMKGDLSEAAFWVGLRQEIYSAMMHHKTLKLNLEHCQIDRTTTSATDFTWANRACVHCADVLNVCFGEEGVTVSNWNNLKDHNTLWRSSRPTSFNPIFYKEADESQGNVIPEIWHHHPCHIIGVQHHLLAALLLSIFDPSLPKTGRGRRAAERAMEEAIRVDLMELCGIGLHNNWTPPAMFTASMGIALCGDRITKRMDQEALFHILCKTEKDHARPTKAVQEQMMEAWDWERD